MRGHVHKCRCLVHRCRCLVVGHNAQTERERDRERERKITVFSFRPNSVCLRRFQLSKFHGGFAKAGTFPHFFFFSQSTRPQISRFDGRKKSKQTRPFLSILTAPRPNMLRLGASYHIKSKRPASGQTHRRLSNVYYAHHRFTKIVKKTFVRPSSNSFRFFLTIHAYNGWFTLIVRTYDISGTILFFFFLNEIVYWNFVPCLFY